MHSICLLRILYTWRKQLKLTICVQRMKAKQSPMSHCSPEGTIQNLPQAPIQIESHGEERAETNKPDPNKNVHGSDKDEAASNGLLS